MLCFRASLVLAPGKLQRGQLLAPLAGLSRSPDEWQELQLHLFRLRACKQQLAKQAVLDLHRRLPSQVARAAQQGQCTQHLRLRTALHAHPATLALQLGAAERSGQER